MRRRRSGGGSENDKMPRNEREETTEEGTNAGEEARKDESTAGAAEEVKDEAKIIPRPKLCCSYRLLISSSALIAFFNATLIRIGVVMAIICMSGSKVINRTSTEDCPPMGMENDDKLYEFDWSSEMQGLIKSGAFYGFLLGPFVSGFLSFIYGGKIILIIGTFMAGITHVVIPELTRISPYYFFSIRIASGFFGGFIFPATFDILSHWAVPEERQILIGGALIGVPLCCVVNFPLNGLICTQLGWEWVLYFLPIWLSIYSILVYFFIFDQPEQCPYITSIEIEYISGKAPARIKGLKVPWRKIFQSLPVYAYFITHFCINYGFLTIILHLPVFMQEVHHFRISTNSLLSASPYLGALFSRILITFTFDKTWKRLKVTKNHLRKTYLLIGVFVPSMALIVVSFIPCKNRYIALACFIIFATTLEISISGGYLLSLVDMCPGYNNILTGISNVLANSAGLLTASITGIFTRNGTVEEWNTVFYLTIGFLAMAGLSYTLFGTSDLQPWGMARGNHPPSEEDQRRTTTLKSNSHA